MDAKVGNSAAPIHSDVMRYAGEEYIPLWIGFVYLGSNIVLNTLNFYWFRQMIDAVRKRFQPPKTDPKKGTPIVTRSTSVDGKNRVVIDETDVRRRIAVAVDEPIDAIS